MTEFIVKIASSDDASFAEQICRQMEESAKERGTGIAKRSPEYLVKKMDEGKAIIALTEHNEWVGFCYIEVWDGGKFVANSGLIVTPEHRKSGIAKRIKEKAFELSRTKYPDAKIVGITTSLAVMKINSELGYRPTTFSELPVGDDFWKGCSSCVNYDFLTRNNRKHCACTGMICDPVEDKKAENKPWDFLKNAKIYERWQRLKNRMLFGEKEETSL